MNLKKEKEMSKKQNQKIPKKTEPEHCPLCKDGHLNREIRKTTYRFKTKSVEVDQPGLYCDSCGEGFLSTKDMTYVQKELKGLIGK